MLIDLVAALEAIPPGNSPTASSPEDQSQANGIYRREDAPPPPITPSLHPTLTNTPPLHTH